MIGALFTGQACIEDHKPRHILRESVACGKCGEPIGLRTVLPEDTGLAWFDPYAGEKGLYVHRKCLSDRRKAEIETVEKSFVASEQKGNSMIRFDVCLRGKTINTNVPSRESPITCPHCGAEACGSCGACSCPVCNPAQTQENDWDAFAMASHS